ncbi:MAG: tetraacyldisaccharide 4'-kinase [Rickettsiales bacterium]|jgi:tetraacyldisaccharide 4'-kinase|nr:tetraacyldisaccharide 4'-kinase [Rickettsiales bacterium]
MKTPFWFHRFNPIALLLTPLSVVYFIISKIVFIYRLFCRKSSKTPVICVGGILAGGVGKTPVVREIAKYLNSLVVMRGYRGKGAKSGAPVRGTDAARDVGDEAKMLAESGIKVYVGDRRENIDVINYGDYKASAIILDDGFQNPGIKKDISIIVFDESVGAGNGLLLPAGPLRETLASGIRRCDAVLVSQSDFGAGCVRILRMAKRRKKPVFFIKKELDTSGMFGKYVAFAGIGYPGKFFDALRNVASIRIVERIPFSDHHSYIKDDIIKLFRLARQYDARLVCTEKDWVKLPHNIRAKVKYVPLKITLQPNFYLWLERKLGTKDEK